MSQVAPASTQNMVKTRVNLVRGPPSAKSPAAFSRCFPFFRSSESTLVVLLNGSKVLTEPQRLRSRICTWATELKVRFPLTFLALYLRNASRAFFLERRKREKRSSEARLQETTLKWWLRVQETTLTPRQVFAWRKLWTGGLSSSKKFVSGSWPSANQDCKVRK